MTEHEVFGLGYRYSEHKQGDRITYRVEGRAEHGEILWVAAGSLLVSGQLMPPHYWVVPDGGGFPHAVLFGDVVVDA